jgi:hypothetical protein
VQVNIELQVGQAVQHVQVSAAALQVEASTSSIGTVIENRKIVDLPLNGRNFLQLALLTPATTPPAPGNLIDAYYPTRSSLGSINGGRISSNYYLLDGLDITNPELDTPAINPSIDFLQEFKIMTNSFNAELGRNQAVVNAISRSGTNQLHGGVYEFLRNNTLDARNFFDRSDVAPFKRNPPYKQNQFGGALGGPLSMPGVYSGRDRTFFFANYEGTRIRQGFTSFGHFPTPQELAGDLSSFSGTITNPFTHVPYLNNQVPVDPKAAVLAKYFSAPNIPLAHGINYVASPSTSNRINQFNGRIDHRFTERDSLFGRYSFSDGNTLQPGLVPLSGTVFTNRGQSLGIGETHTFSSTLLNEFRFGFMRSRFVNNAEGAYTDNVAGSLFSNVGAEPIQWGVPLVGIQGYSGIGAGGAAFAPLEYNTNIYQFRDSMTKVVRRHTLKVGADIERMIMHPRVDQMPRGSLSFNGSMTGNPIADFLVGVPYLSQVAALSSRGNLFGTWYAFFLQDDWKVSSKLMLNLGVRYEYNSPLVEENDNIATVSFVGGGAFVSPNAAAVAKYPGLLKPAPTRGLWFPDRNNWAPRVGFAYRPFANNRTALRGGFGIFYDLPEQNENLILRINPPFYYTVYVGNNPANPTNTFQNLFPPPVFTAPALSEFIPYAFEQHDRSPYVTQWNLNIQQELRPGLLLEVGYLGSKGTKLLQRLNANQTVVNGNGNFFDNIGLVPYPNLSPILLFKSEHGANSNYNALTVKVEKRYAQGLMLLAAYTWSKSLSNIDGTGATGGSTSIITYRHKPGLDYGVSEFDQGQRLSLSYTYDIPVGRGRHFLPNMNKVAEVLWGGWQLTGITTFASGFPFSVFTPSNTSGTSLVNPMRPDTIGNPTLPDSERTWQRWFDTSAFALPTPGRFGTLGRDTMRADGTSNFDVGFLKNITVSDRVSAQFRTEMFNAFNAHQFGYPGHYLNVSGFGVAASAGPGRIIQFALKLLF